MRDYNNFGHGNMVKLGALYFNFSHFGTDSPVSQTGYKTNKQHIVR